MLAWTLARLKRCAEADAVIVATSDRDCDEGIAELGRGMGLPVVRGSCDDVLGRAVKAMREQRLERMVRISGDSPFIDPLIVDELLVRQAQSGADMLSNVYPHRRLVSGLSVEVLNERALLWLDAQAGPGPDREHVTSLAYRRARAGDCPLRIESGGPELENRKGGTGPVVSLAVDTPEDFTRAGQLAVRFGDALETASWREILAAIASAGAAELVEPLGSGTVQPS
jgi:spore coat polysaccharide biosynthesis protein SpsF (cytidylyltransferase family)